MEQKYSMADVGKNPKSQEPPDIGWKEKEVLLLTFLLVFIWVPM